MAFKNEDLRLSLSLPTSQNCFPLELVMFPSSMLHSKINYTGENPEQCPPTSVLSSLCGKRSERDDKENEDGQNSHKKLKISKEQMMVLEESFKEHSTLNNKEKGALAKQLSLSPRQVEVWFQNRRARTKLKQTEVECEYLKSWCQKLAEENKRLQNEIGELRSLNSLSSPTALNMFPSFQSITAPQSELWVPYNFSKNSF